VDGKEGVRYNGIVGKIVFDSTDDLHYLSFDDNKIYLVETKIK